jgi:hypothetical protein
MKGGVIRKQLSALMSTSPLTPKNNATLMLLIERIHDTALSVIKLYCSGGVIPKSQSHNPNEGRI